MGNFKSYLASSDPISSSKNQTQGVDNRQQKISRGIAFAKRNKVAPCTNASSSHSEFPSTRRLHEIFCRPNVSSSQSQVSSEDCSFDHYQPPHEFQASKPEVVQSLAIHCHSSESSSKGSDTEETGGGEIGPDLEIATQEQIQSTEQQQNTFDSVVPQISENLLKLRKMHIGKCMVNEIQELSTIEEKLQRLQEHQNDRQNNLLLLMTVRARAASVSRKASKLNVSIKKLHKAYRKHERRLYKARAERAVCEANVDRYLTKLYPAVGYTDIYARRQSFYLSPIPEESELDLEEYELDIFPSEMNTSLAAVTLQQFQLFFDASPSSQY